LISRLTILHSTQWYYELFLSDDGQLYFGQHHVILNCLRHLQDISGIGAEIQVSNIRFQTFAILSRLQVTELQAYCSQRKSLTFYGFSDVLGKED
jgi:hypothetical protein